MAKAAATTGEDAIVQTYLAPLAAGYPGAFGLRDDCALIAPEPGTELVVKTDPVRAGVHFFATDAPEDIAWKALAVNVSDLAAKGAKPLAYLLALAFPEMPDAAWLQRFADGLAAAQQAFGCHLIGGDTDRAPGPLSIGVTAFGSVPAGRMLRRGGARAGDRVFVSGAIGDSALGLHARSNTFARRFWPLDADERAFLARRYLRPEPRLALRSALLAHATAGMDVSDGLAKDLARMARASGVAVRLDAARVPLSVPGAKVVAAVAEWRTGVLTGGDDYEILAAVAPADAAAFAKAAADAGVAVTETGSFAAGAGLTVVGADGAEITLDRTGWDHF